MIGMSTDTISCGFCGSNSNNCYYHTMGRSKWGYVIWVVAILNRDIIRVDAEWGVSQFKLLS